MGNLDSFGNNVQPFNILPESNVTVQSLNIAKYNLFTKRTAQIQEDTFTDIQNQINIVANNCNVAVNFFLCLGRCT